MTHLVKQKLTKLDNNNCDKVNIDFMERIDFANDLGNPIITFKFKIVSSKPNELNIWKI